MANIERLTEKASFIEHPVFGLVSYVRKVKYRELQQQNNK